MLLKFGFIGPDVDVRASVSGTPVTRKVTDAETQYGMGIQFRMGEKVSFRAEVERFDFSRIVTYTSASLQFRF